jgi:hypothetical protein
VTRSHLGGNPARQDAPPQVSWQRSAETLTARKDDISGLAVASDERIKVCVLYIKDGEIVSLRPFVEDQGVRLTRLLSRLRAEGMGTFRVPKVHPSEISRELLKTLGFRPAGRHLLYAPKARSD